MMWWYKYQVDFCLFIVYPAYRVDVHPKNPVDGRRVLSCRSGHGNCLPLQWFNHTMYYCRLASHISIYPKFQPGVRNPLCPNMYDIICKLSFESYRVKTFCRWGSVVQLSHPFMFQLIRSWNNHGCSTTHLYGTVVLFPLLLLHVNSCKFSSSC